jgi:hypothetical protein
MAVKTEVEVFCVLSPWSMAHFSGLHNTERLENLNDFLLLLYIQIANTERGIEFSDLFLWNDKCPVMNYRVGRWFVIYSEQKKNGWVLC